MATYNKFNQFVKDLIDGFHSCGTHSFKVCLSNTAPSAANTVLSNITQISAGNGYVSGGAAVATTSTSIASGTAKFSASADTVFTASGGSIASLRYAVLYNDTQTSPVKPLVSWWDYGSSVAPATGETFTVDFDQTNGIFQLA